MILAYPVRPARSSLIPAVIHRNGTCRLQLVDARIAPLFHALITRFRDLTGVPMVLNTSFNDQEPLVATPDDALNTFARLISMPFSRRSPCSTNEMKESRRYLLKV